MTSYKCPNCGSQTVNVFSLAEIVTRQDPIGLSMGTQHIAVPYPEVTRLECVGCDAKESADEETPGELRFPNWETTGQHSGTLRLCAHDVDYRYWDFPKELLEEPDFVECLDQAANDEAYDKIKDNYVEGQLSCNYGDETVYGWWEIKKP